MLLNKPHFKIHFLFFQNHHLETFQNGGEGMNECQSYILSPLILTTILSKGHYSTNFIDRIGKSRLREIK